MLQNKHTRNYFCQLVVTFAPHRFNYFVQDFYRQCNMNSVCDLYYSAHLTMPTESKIKGLTRETTSSQADKQFQTDN